MNNNIVDKVYLALELTRLWNFKQANRKDIMETFNYFLNSLTGIEDITIIDKLKKELEETKDKYNNLRDNMETIVEEKVAYKKDVLKHILDNAKGDMEPHVYESLQKLIK